VHRNSYADLSAKPAFPCWWRGRRAAATRRAFDPSTLAGPLRHSSDLASSPHLAKSGCLWRATRDAGVLSLRPSVMGQSYRAAAVLSEDLRAPSHFHSQTRLVYNRWHRPFSGPSETRSSTSNFTLLPDLTSICNSATGNRQFLHAHASRDSKQARKHGSCSLTGMDPDLKLQSAFQTHPKKKEKEKKKKKGYFSNSSRAIFPGSGPSRAPPPQGPCGYQKRVFLF